MLLGSFSAFSDMSMLFGVILLLNWTVQLFKLLRRPDLLNDTDAFWETMGT